MFKALVAVFAMLALSQGQTAKAEELTVYDGTLALTFWKKTVDFLEKATLQISVSCNEKKAEPSFSNVPCIVLGWL